MADFMFPNFQCGLYENCRGQTGAAYFIAICLLLPTKQTTLRKTFIATRNNN